MTTPNRFARNASFLVLSTYDSDEDINQRFDSLPNSSWSVRNVERFVNELENEDARITISNGNIEQFTFTASQIWIDIEGAPVQTTNLDEVLDFFTAP